MKLYIIFIITVLFLTSCGDKIDITKLKDNDVVNYDSNLCVKKGYKSSFEFNIDITKLLEESDEFSNEDIIEFIEDEFSKTYDSKLVIKNKFNIIDQIPINYVNRESGFRHEIIQKREKGKFYFKVPFNIGKEEVSKKFTFNVVIVNKTGDKIERGVSKDMFVNECKPILKIERFTVYPISICPGDSAELEWKIFNPDNIDYSLEINGEPISNYITKVKISHIGKYTLNVKYDGKTLSDSVYLNKKENCGGGSTGGGSSGRVRPHNISDALNDNLPKDEVQVSNIPKKRKNGWEYKVIFNDAIPETQRGNILFQIGKFTIQDFDHYNNHPIYKAMTALQSAISKVKEKEKEKNKEKKSNETTFFYILVKGYADGNVRCDECVFRQLQGNDENAIHNENLYYLGERGIDVITLGRTNFISSGVTNKDLPNLRSSFIRNVLTSHLFGIDGDPKTPVGIYIGEVIPGNNELYRTVRISILHTEGEAFPESTIRTYFK